MTATDDANPMSRPRFSTRELSPSFGRRPPSTCLSDRFPRIASLAPLAVALVVAASCSRSRQETAPEPTASTPAAATAQTRDPFGFGPCTTSAKTGDFVLAPSGGWLDEGAASPNRQQHAYIFFGARMEQPGAKVSTIRTSGGEVMELPNCLVVPVGRKATAKPGDIVLTHRKQGGAGMQRAVVVDGGAPESPRVRYLDIRLDHPSGAGSRTDTCQPGTFLRLQDLWQPGTSVAVRTPMGHERWTVIRAKKDRVLALGFGGKITILNRAGCLPLPITSRFRVGQDVWVPHLGAFRRAKVNRFDPAMGRVFADVEIAEKTVTMASPVLDVLVFGTRDSKEGSSG